MYCCPACNEQLTLGIRFCPWCGAGLGAADYPVVSPERMARMNKAVKTPVGACTNHNRLNGRPHPRGAVAPSASPPPRANMPAHRAPRRTEEFSHQRQDPDHESRRHRRCPVQVRVVLRVGSERHGGFTENLGSGGLFVATDADLAVDQQLSVCFTMPGGQPDTIASCQVRWQRPAREDRPGLGLRFMALNPVVRAELDSICRRHEARCSRNRDRSPWGR